MDNNHVTKQRTVFIDTIVSGAKINRFHLVLFIVLFLMHTVGGFATNIYGVIVNPMMEELGMNTITAGVLGSTFFYGMVIGSLISAFLGTKIGYKRMILIWASMTLISCLIMGTTRNVNVFAAVRFISGISIAGLIPCTIGTMTEWAPIKYKNLLGACVSMGTPVGSVICSLTGIRLMSIIGWRGLYLFELAMIVPIILVAIVVPNSMDQMLKKGDTHSISQILHKVDPQYQLTANDVYTFTPANMPKVKVKITDLFKNGFARNTITLWCTHFCNLLSNFGIQTWLPAILIGMGYGLEFGLVALTMYNLGGLLGMPLLGTLIGKYSAKRVSIVAYAVIIVCILSLTIPSNTVVAAIILLITGTCINGIIGNITPYAWQNYPTYLRPMMLGCLTGVPRFGAALGPVLGGILLTGAPPVASFIFFAIVLIVALVMYALTQDRTREFSGLADKKRV